MAVTAKSMHIDAPGQKVGGIAALTLALAPIGAIPQFLLVVDRPSETTATDLRPRTTGAPR